MSEITVKVLGVLPDLKDLSTKDLLALEKDVIEVVFGKVNVSKEMDDLYDAIQAELYKRNK